MGSELQQPERDKSPTSSAEVEFALVLSRMIESLQNDPEHLRATVYELARYKLREQLVLEETTNTQQLSKSLEVAIQGVENFAVKDNRNRAWLERPTLERPSPPVLAVMSALRGGIPARTEPADKLEVETTSRFARPERRSQFNVQWLLGLMFLMMLAVAFVLKQRVIEMSTFQKRSIPSNDVRSPHLASQSEVSSFRERAAEFETLKPPSPLIPTTYGIFAVSGDKLYELDLLMARAPDIRIAVSAAILTPSKVMLPDGHIKFIVYRRDSGTSAADRAEIRVVAKITREMSFDKAGKSAVVAKSEDTWVLRNISIPLRTAPKKDNPDMYEIQSENADNALTPGRYALVLKGQAYDFSIAGAVTDPRQCLEQLAATNGQFYSECPKS
jgi:hypothetical protein